MSFTQNIQPQTPHILLIDDDDDYRHALTQSLVLSKYQVEEFNHAEKGLQKLNKNTQYIVITDINMPEIDGMQFLAKVMNIDPAIPVIVITGHGNISSAVEAMRAGAYDFIEKPFAIERLTNMIDRAFEKRHLVIENRDLKNKLNAKDNLQSSVIGSSEKMQDIRSKIKTLANAHVDVLLLGETGTGKEVIARALHDEGERSSKPFVAINCGAIPLEMMESELFGHEVGAFTSANKKRIGRLEYANGGTVFLDEIESMPMELQIKLLRVIETRTLEPLGSNKSIPINVRFIAASKINLEDASKNNHFRADLFYRLNVVSIDIPPLRDRKEDIPELCQHFVINFQSRYGQGPEKLMPDQIAQFQGFNWPGNVRELRNMVERICLGFGQDFQLNQINTTNFDLNSNDKLHQRITKFEAQIIETELSKHNGNMKKTYESLGISRKSLYDKIQKYGIKKPSTVAE